MQLSLNSSNLFTNKTKQRAAYADNIMTRQITVVNGIFTELENKAYRAGLSILMKKCSVKQEEKRQVKGHYK